MSGLQTSSSGNLMTLFSATNYGGKYQNKGAILKITKQCKMVPLFLSQSQ